MRNLKYLFLFILLGLVVPSCVEDVAPEDAFGPTTNLASFERSSLSISGIANGAEYPGMIALKVKGPTSKNISTPVTATISVDPSSTAIEGTHFRLEQKSIQLTPENGFLGTLPIAMLTDGILAPLEKNPVLVLNVATVSGADNLITDGKKLTVNLLYLCFSNLAGTYDVTITRSDNPTVYQRVDQITQTAEGEYRTTFVGHYTVADLGGTPGFTFQDVCNEITVPEQNLVDLYSNLVYQDGNSYADPVNGKIHIEYTVTFAAGPRKYVADYVKQ